MINFFVDNFNFGLPIGALIDRITIFLSGGIIAGVNSFVSAALTVGGQFHCQ